MKEILLTSTEQNIQQFINWGMVLLLSLLILRVLRDFLEAIAEPETGIKEAFRKTKKRIFAAIIALTIESTIIFFQSFYK